MELVWWMRHGVPPASTVDELPLKFYLLAPAIDRLFDTVKYDGDKTIEATEPGDVVIPLNNGW